MEQDAHFTNTLCFHFTEFHTALPQHRVLLSLYIISTQHQPLSITFCTVSLRGPGSSPTTVVSKLRQFFSPMLPHFQKIPHREIKNCRGHTEPKTRTGTASAAANKTCGVSLTSDLSRRILALYTTTMLLILNGSLPGLSWLVSTQQPAGFLTTKTNKQKHQITNTTLKYATSDGDDDDGFCCSKSELFSINCSAHNVCIIQQLVSVSHYSVSFTVHIHSVYRVPGKLSKLTQSNIKYSACYSDTSRSIT